LGFEDPHHPQHVCKLNQALYKLKQALRAWFDRLNSFLLNLGFFSSTTDLSLFIHHSSFGILILLLYVDDMVVTDNNPAHIQWLVTHLGHEFTIKDLGFLHHFLGIEVRHFNHDLFFCQTHYAKDLLSRAHLEGYKALATPMALYSRKLPGNDELFLDPTHYRSIVGALQYLTFTHPDISYSVNFACQFMHSPTTAHFKLVKHILRYITLVCELFLQVSLIFMPFYMLIGLVVQPLDILQLGFAPS
jgi:hypothetical protein